VVKVTGSTSELLRKNRKSAGDGCTLDWSGAERLSRTRVEWIPLAVSKNRAGYGGCKKERGKLQQDL
jgi:hypothetical protein